MGAETGFHFCRVCNKVGNLNYRYMLDLGNTAEESFMCINCDLYSYEYSYGNIKNVVGNKEFIFHYKEWFESTDFNKHVAKMKGELPFHLAMSNALNDKLLRGVFADYLEEQGDERCKGYRALGRQGKLLLKSDADFAAQFNKYYYTYLSLPKVWDFKMYYHVRWAEMSWANTRYATEEKAVEVFLSLTEEQQDEIMSL